MNIIRKTPRNRRFRAEANRSTCGILRPILAFVVLFGVRA
jgi:hypothetical protein